MATRRRRFCRGCSSSIASPINDQKSWSLLLCLPLMRFLQPVFLLLAFLCLVAALISPCNSATASSETMEQHDRMQTNLPDQKQALLLIDDRGAAAISYPAFIYESVAASLSSTLRGDYDRGSLHDNVAQEEHAFFLADGHDSVKLTMQKKDHPNTAKPLFIYEAVAASLYPEAGSVIRATVPQENRDRAKGGGKDVDGEKIQEAKTIRGKSYIHEYVAAQLSKYNGAAHANEGSHLQDNIPEKENSSLIDDGGTHVHNVRTAIKSMRPFPPSPTIHQPMTSALSHAGDAGGGNLRDNVGNVPILDSGDNFHVHGESLGKASTKEYGGSVLRNSVPAQGEYAFLRDDGGVKHVEEGHDGGDGMMKKHKKQGPKLDMTRQSFNKGRLRMVVGDSLESAQLDDGSSVPTREESEAEVEGSPDILRMVVDDDYSKTLVQQGYDTPPASEDNLRMVVGDASNDRIQQGPIRGRSRSCTVDPDVCHRLAHAEHMNHIALYGQLTTLSHHEKKPACCGGMCVDLNDHRLHCGRCGKPCAFSQTCCNGKCTDLNTDDFNCGQCGHSCPSFSPCQYGMCGYY